jgi:TetR/AcrR family transcriptional regulator, regulator of autoinduction and epiphytic fitness
MAQAQKKKRPADQADPPSGSAEGYQQRVSREKRKLILDVAIAMFLENGYEAATMDAIGDRASVSYATLYKHFPSKDVLFSEAVDHLIHQLFSRWKDHVVPADLEAGLREIGRAYYELVSDTNLIAAMRMVIAQVRKFPDIGMRFQSAKQLFSDVTDAWLRKHVEAGRLQIGDVQLARAEFIGMLGETLFYPQLALVDYAIPDVQVADVIDSAVSTFLARYR